MTVVDRRVDHVDAELERARDRVLVHDVGRAVLPTEVRAEADRRDVDPVELAEVRGNDGAGEPRQITLRPLGRRAASDQCRHRVSLPGRAGGSTDLTIASGGDLEG